MSVRVSHLAYQKIVFQGLSNIVSFMSIFLQALSNEMLCGVRNRNFLREIDFLIDDAGEVVRVADFKGDGPIEQLISQDSNAPDVDFAVVVLTFGHLWRSVERRPALGVPHEGGVDGPSKITNLDCVFNDKDVLRLDVAVDDIILVHVFDCHANLLDIFPHIFFLKGSLVQPFIQILARACLEQQVDVFRICGKAVKVDNIGMVKIALDDGLSDELVEALFVQLALLYDLEAEYGLRDHMLHQMNLPIAALIHKFQHLKHLFLVVYQKSLELSSLGPLKEGFGW